MNFGGTIRINRFGLLIIACLLIILVYYNISSSSSSEQPQKVNLRQLLLAALEAAEKGGHEVVKGSHEPSAGAESKGETKEGVNIPVTKADYNSHCVMFYGIAKTFPFLKVSSSGWIGVENTPAGEILPLPGVKEVPGSNPAWEERLPFRTWSHLCSIPGGVEKSTSLIGCLS